MKSHLNRDIYSRNGQIRMYILLCLDDAMTDPSLHAVECAYPRQA